MSIFNYFSKIKSDDNIKDNKNKHKDNEIIKKDENIVGLKIIENIFDKEYHDKLWNKINENEWDTTLSRRTQHFGYKYNYKSRKLKDEDIAPPLPQYALDLIELLLDKQIIKDIPKQLIINEYKDNQGISAHVDSKVFGNLIFSVSLGSKCKMVFKRKINDKNSDGKIEYEKIEKELLPNSIVLMQDESRYNWTHEIPKLKKGSHRISLTFRYLPESKEKDEKLKELNNVNNVINNNSNNSNSNSDSDNDNSNSNNSNDNNIKSIPQTKETIKPSTLPKKSSPSTSSSTISNSSPLFNSNNNKNKNKNTRYSPY